MQYSSQHSADATILNVYTLDNKIFQNGIDTQYTYNKNIILIFPDIF